MYATLDQNPYPKGTFSYKIWERNKDDKKYDIGEAKDRDKYIIFLYVMGSKIRHISNKIGLSESSVHRVLNNYHVKLGS